MNAKFFAFSASGIFLSSCVSPGPATANAVPSEAHWQQGNYTVVFRAGPREGERSLSRYQVTRGPSGEDLQTLVLESAQSTQGFLTVTNPAPKNHIRVVSGSAGDPLVIEEDIPNDCGPCRNFALVQPDGRGQLAHRWLRLPEKSYPGGGINSEFPSVTAVTSATLTYRYSDGTLQTVKISSLPVEDRPQRPG